MMDGARLRAHGKAVARRRTKPGSNSRIDFPDQLPMDFQLARYVPRLTWCQNTIFVERGAINRRTASGERLLRKRNRGSDPLVGSRQIGARST
jgi:hypothetical protein